MSIPLLQTLAHTILIFNIAVADILIIVSMIGVAFSAIQALIRANTISFRLIAHFILSLVITYTAASLFGNNNMVYITGIVSFYNVFFLASLLAATNLDSRECLPDIVIPLSFVLFFLISNHTSLIQHLQIAYLAIRVGIKFAVFVRINRRYWYWINPPPPTEDLSATRQSDRDSR